MAGTRVLLVDDHPVVRVGIRTLLEQLDDIQVVGEAENGRDALKFLQAQVKEVDVVLMDVSMTDLNGISTAGYIAQDYPTVRVLILSMHSDPPYVLSAVQAGVAGYLPKSAQRDELELAIRTVARGGTYLSPAVAGLLMDDYRRLTGKEPTRTHDPLATPFLRPHDRELLQLIAEGCATKEIATRLHIGVKAVESRRVRLMERLDIHDVAGLVRYAMRTGIVPEER